ncbi:hypothetical protein A2662_01925 [Candidatus Giovannonibacteria bacterium RIFCSPHIGHO2_01_FULL_45_33]|uniref:N-acetyltransferase domain-containing protein n=1 Tax=Candidatus Giovannonibacteria bacterium RIFCSPLOWO2_01_FULL_45_34 TaxID=1798351 RepID=A0A1F5WZK3_9BACT|nr:MAG: hypothetical protein A2662_01925 [Candidatus Giovannonibacteria bacterium RIFCSPHIGHO2_01_FULL_45_33]OGF69035.1 MAG: hypothetical protein A3C73_00725 [Candidatus Giovannonibacteria bacterium RIFCSPHIGHO2_02_FULL_44_11]OGF81049.1 MAG: hypothetical protein A2930_03265 [Candidatus Giovannonibacteria bacterium RIFCSPLOWO2_01_FULL_45_34]
MKIKIVKADERHRKDINRLIREANIGDGIEGPVKNFWLAKLDDKIVGCAGLNFVGNKSAIFTHLVVEREYRHRGIGSALIVYRKRIAKEHDTDTLALITMYYHFNFYKRRGFKVVKRADLPNHLKNYWMFTAERYKKCAVLLQSI